MTLVVDVGDVAVLIQLDLEAVTFVQSSTSYSIFDFFSSRSAFASVRPDIYRRASW